MSFAITADHRDQFQRDGYLLVPGLLSAGQARLLDEVSSNDAAKQAQTRSIKDAEGGDSHIWLSSEPAEDIYNAIARSKLVAGATAALLDDAVYLYHYKMMCKEPRGGGAWEWHQDYGYWYNNGCLYPDMGSCMIAVDPATRANGCLQVLAGSHLCGRLEHGTYGGQTGADPERVARVQDHHREVYCEMEPGDGLFFHCNLLHASAANHSPQRRWVFICCYNTRHNPTDDKPGHPSYAPMELWPDTRIGELGRRQLGSIMAPADRAASDRRSP